MRDIHLVVIAGVCDGAAAMLATVVLFFWVMMELAG